jgi:hypothetical protein
VGAGSGKIRRANSRRGGFRRQHHEAYAHLDTNEAPNGLEHEIVFSLGDNGDDPKPRDARISNKAELEGDPSLTLTTATGQRYFFPSRDEFSAAFHDASQRQTSTFLRDGSANEYVFTPAFNSSGKIYIALLKADASTRGELGEQGIPKLEWCLENDRALLDFDRERAEAFSAAIGAEFVHEREYEDQLRSRRQRGVPWELKNLEPLGF